MVPGIQGSFTSDSLQDLKTSNINFGYLKQQNHHARRIVLQSKVDWRDTIHDDHDGKFRVILTAEAAESEDLDERFLSGSVFIYQLAKEPKISDDGRINLEWFDNIHSMQKIIDDYKTHRNAGAWEDIRENLNKLYNNTLSSLNDNGTNLIPDHFFHVNFSVNPHGVTSLKFVDNEKSDLDNTQKYIIIRQAFYYIKYSLHSHKHHYSKEDSLTTIVQIENKEKGPSKIEALKMIGQLKRELTNIKRTYSNGGQKVYGEEQGIIAYMNSLCASLRSMKIIDDDTFKRETHYLSSLSKSFSVQVEKREKRDKCADDIRSVYRIYVAWFFSISSLAWLTSVRGFIEYSESSKIIVKFGMIEHAVVFLTILFCSVLIYRSQIKRKIKNTLDEKGFISWLEENYLITDKDFNKFKIKSFIKSFSIFALSMLFVFLIDYLLTS